MSSRKIPVVCTNPKCRKTVYFNLTNLREKKPCTECGTKMQDKAYLKARILANVQEKKKLSRRSRTKKTPPAARHYGKINNLS